jgi:hypothetical protein
MGEIEKLERTLADTYHLSPKQVKSIIQKVLPISVSQTLYDIELLIRAGKIKDIGAFTAKTFDNKFGLGFFNNSSN